MGQDQTAEQANCTFEDPSGRVNTDSGKLDSDSHRLMEGDHTDLLKSPKGIWVGEDGGRQCLGLRNL